jgi:hypothetical protein
MKTNDIESQLTELGSRWPVTSVAEAVQSRLEAIPPTAKLSPSHPILKWYGMGAVAAAAMVLIAICTSMFMTPSTLYAQVKESIRKSLSVHLQIVSVDSSGSRTIGTLWYSRELGVRGEAGNEVFIDDGKQQWTWAAADNAPAVVSRRASRDGIAMVADTLQLPPQSEALVRASEFDREILDEKCKAFKVSASEVKGKNAQVRLPPIRILAWQNEAGKVLLVRSEQFDTAKNEWKMTREVSMTYDVEVPRDKFTPQFPASTTIVNEDRVWLDRYPLEKALATAESGGLLFGVHELKRCENGSYYVVSSVRGTAEHLKQHPPKSRKLNLQTTLLEVAEQFCSATTQQDFKLVPIASSEIDGVHFLWWLATDRSYFKVEGGKRIPQPVGKKLESEPGIVELPLMANYRGELQGKSIVHTKATLTLPQDTQVLSLRDVAVRVQQDADIPKDGLLVHTFENATGRYVPSSSITADQMVQSFQAALEWLGDFDELGEVSLGGASQRPAN